MYTNTTFQEEFDAMFEIWNRVEIRDNYFYDNQVNVVMQDVQV